MFGIGLPEFLLAQAIVLLVIFWLLNRRRP